MEMIADTGRLSSVDIVELNPALDERNRPRSWRWISSSAVRQEHADAAARQGTFPRHLRLGECPLPPQSSSMRAFTTPSPRSPSSRAAACDRSATRPPRRARDRSRARPRCGRSRGSSPAPAAEPERAVGHGQLVGVEHLAVRGAPAVEARPVPGAPALLDPLGHGVRERRALPVGAATSRAASAATGGEHDCRPRGTGLRPLRRRGQAGKGSAD